MKPGLRNMVSLLGRLGATLKIRSWTGCCFAFSCARSERALERLQPPEHRVRLRVGDALRPATFVTLAHQDDLARGRPADKYVGARTRIGRELGELLGQDGM